MEILQSNINGTLSAGTESFGGWNTYKGGRVTVANTTSKKPGAKYSHIVLGGKTIEAVTLTVDYDPLVHGPMEDRLEELAGGTTVFTVGKVERDGSGNILRVKTRVGYLLEVGGSEGDTNSDTDKATLEVVIGING